MPSGPKKRKAARKKVQKEAHTTTTNNNNNNNPHENDDRRSQDERDSDIGDIDSPASGDHNNQTHPFHEGNGESGKRDPSPVRSVVAENKSMEEVSADAEGAQQVGLEDGGIVKIEREFKIEDDSERKIVSIEHVEFAKESHDRENGSSSSSSSDDESRVFGKKLEEKAYNSDLEVTFHHDEAKSTVSLSEEVAQVSENATYVETDNNLVVEPAPVVDEVKSLVPLSEEVVEVVKSASVENSVVSDVVGSVLKENVEKLLPTSDEVTGFSLASADVVSKETNENKVFVLSDEIVGATSNVAGSAINGSECKILTASGDPNGMTDVIPKKNNEDKVFPISDENVGASSNVVGTAINGNEGIILTSSVDPNAMTDVVPKKNNEDKVFPISDENVGASSNVVGTAINGNEGIILTSSGAPIAGTSSGAEYIKDPVIPECSENEPLLASAPRMVQRTSWLSCCGLFEAITGSSA